MEILGSKIVKIQTNPLSRQQKPDHLRAMERLVDDAFLHFDSLKKSLREGRSPPDNSDMVNVIVKINEYDSRLVDVKTTIGQLMRCFVDTQTLVPDMRKKQTELVQLSKYLEDKQKKRQGIIWSILEETRRCDVPSASPVSAVPSVFGGGGAGGGGGGDETTVEAFMSSLVCDEDLEEAAHLTLSADHVVNCFHSIASDIHDGGGGGGGGNELKVKKRDHCWDSLFSLPS